VRDLNEDLKSQLHLVEPKDRKIPFNCGRRYLGAAEEEKLLQFVASPCFSKFIFCDSVAIADDLVAKAFGFLYFASANERKRIFHIYCQLVNSYGRSSAGNSFRAHIRMKSSASSNGLPSLQEYLCSNLWQKLLASYISHPPMKEKGFSTYIAS
jgi:hypothetical protein